MSVSASPGSTAKLARRSRYSLPVRSISPQLGVGGGMPTPRNASAASSRIATEDSTTICVRIGLHELGRMVRNML